MWRSWPCTRAASPSRFAAPVALALAWAPAAALAQDPFDPAADPAAAALDPTRIDTELEATIGRRVKEAGRPPLPAVSLRGLLIAGGIVDVAIDAAGRVERIRPGATVLAGDGTRLEVVALDTRGATLRSAAHDEEIDLQFGHELDAVDPDRIAVLDLRELPIEHVCRMIAARMKRNVVPSKGASSIAVSMFLRDVDTTDALRALCDAYQLWFTSEAGSPIVHIRTVEEYRRDLTDLQEERTEVFTLHYPNVYDVGYAIRDLFGERVSLTVGGAQDDLLLDLSDRLSRFDIFDGRTQGFGQNNGFGAASGFGNEFGDGGGIGYGGGIGGRYGGSINGLSSRIREGDSGGETIQPVEKEAIRAEFSAAEIRQLEELLSKRDAAAASAEEVSRELARKYVAPIHVTAASRQNKLLVRTADAIALEQIRALVKELDVPLSMVLLEFRVLSIDVGDGQESFFEYQWGGPDDDAHGEFSLGDIAAPLSGLGPGGSGKRAGDLIFQFVDSNFGLRVQALERENRVKTLATPVLLTTNNEVSRLFIGREVPLNRTFGGGQTFVNDSTVTTSTGTTSIEFRPVGTTLLVTPNINADRSVTLRVVQENSELNSTAEVLVPSGTTFAVQEIDVVSSQTVSGTIVAKDALAVAFGGLMERGKTEDVSGIPFLRDIPYLGVLFEHREILDIRREIVVVVKPYVIATPADFATVPENTLRGLGVDLDDLHRDPATGLPLPPKAPFPR